MRCFIDTWQTRHPDATLGCEDTCPKNLPLAARIAFLRRRMAVAGR